MTIIFNQIKTIEKNADLLLFKNKSYEIYNDCYLFVLSINKTKILYDIRNRISKGNKVISN